MRADTSSFRAATRTDIGLFVLMGSLFTLALAFISCGVSQMEMLAEVGSVEKRFSARLQPAVRTWIDGQAVKLARFGVEEDGVRDAMRTRFAGQNLSDDGREVLSFLTLARAVDISNQRARIFEDHQKAIRTATEKMRDVLPNLETDLEKLADSHDLAPVPPDCTRYQEEIRRINELLRKTPSRTEFIDRSLDDIGELRAIQSDLKGKLDGMNEMSEMTSLRLQMTMDRRSKFISTLSNIMKKISTTQESLVQNLK